METDQFLFPAASSEEIPNDTNREVHALARYVSTHKVLSRSCIPDEETSSAYSYSLTEPPEMVDSFSTETID